MITYVVTGLNPEPWTAGKFARVKGGRTVVHKDQKLIAYQKALKEEFADITPAFDNGVPLVLKFAFWRDTAHGQPADATNLQKATEDALQGLLYHDDKWVREVSSVIVRQEPRLEPGLVIEFGEAPPKTGWPDEVPKKRSIEAEIDLDRTRRADYDPEF